MIKKFFSFLFVVIFALCTCVGCGTPLEFPSYALRYNISYCAMLDGVRQEIPSDAWLTGGKYPTEYIHGETPVVSGLKETYDTTINTIAATMVCEGWYTDGACTEPFLGITATSRGDITLYAKLTSDRTEFSITYLAIVDGKKQNVPLDMWDVEQEYPARYKKGEQRIIPKLITSIPITVNDLKAEIAIKSWYVDEACTKKFTGITANTRGDISLYAKVTTERLEYLIAYYAVVDGQIQNIPQEFKVESGQYPTVYNVGEATSVSGLKEKYPENSDGAITVFGGWYTDMDCTKQFKGITAQTKGDLSLYAQLFTADASTLRMITYKAVLNGKTVADVPESMFGEGGNYPKAYYEGQGFLMVDNLKNRTITEANKTTKTYTFVAWYLDEGCTQKFTGSLSGVTGDITLYAKIKLGVWSPSV